MSDWVAIGSYLSIAFLVGMMIFFIYKGYQLIYKDSDKK